MLTAKDLGNWDQGIIAERYLTKVNLSLIYASPEIHQAVNGTFI